MIPDEQVEPAVSRWSPALDERAAAKSAIQERLRISIEALQAQADSVVSPTGTLTSDGAACSGVVLVRGAAIEACNNVTSRVCTAAASSTKKTR